MLSAEIWTIAQTNQGNAVLLRPRELGIAVPIFIGQLEMQSILIGREGVSMPRPLTHDLFLNLLRKMKLTLERIEIHELRDNTFHARLIITGLDYTEEKPLVMDSRPSDAFALAVRRRCPILIDSKVVELAGIPLDFFMEESAGLETEADEEERLLDSFSPAAPSLFPSLSSLSSSSSQPSGRRRSLLEQLSRAIAAEEYERAAEIRDTLILLDKEDREKDS
jgi:bifunctional DNase/RNase